MRDGQVEARPFFFHVGGREIDRRFAHRKFVAGIGQRGGNTVARFLHGGVRQADDDDQRFAVAAVHLDLDGVGVNAVQGGGADTGEHWGFLRQPALIATGIFKTQSSCSRFSREQPVRTLKHVRLAKAETAPAIYAWQLTG